MIIQLRFLTVLIFLCLTAFGQDKYSVSLDLNKIKKDRVKVVIKTPSIKEDSAVYIMPSVIPGSYSKKDYGRFISSFYAYDKKGKKLKVQKRGENLFTISDAKTLDKIEYLVDDTWDVKTDSNYIFQPGGTNIEKGKNIVLNHHGFYGYFDRYKMLPYVITVTKPSEFYGETSLMVNRESPTKDVFLATDYVKLVDAPVMYCKPDTASLMAANAKINISVYSETGLVKAGEIKELIKPLTAALQNFFVKMPVDHYHFLFYFPQYQKSAITQFGGFGALEHSYSSFYFLPEMPAERLNPMVLSVVSHEFLHILTPLNIHSEEIEYFDFKEPKMSQHLWLYEGCTEYFANLVQVRDGLMSYDNFLTEIGGKIRGAAEYPNVSFTEMSRNILVPPYEEMYNNVYEKGALIGFLLDIRLMELSNGSLGLRELLLKLSDKYGPNKPFKDDAFIDEIVSMTYPEIQQFFNDYVKGNTPLPYTEYFDKIGWNFFEVKPDTIMSFGMISFGYDDQLKKFIAAETEEQQNLFGLKSGDVILGVNDKEVTTDNYVELLSPLVNVQDMASIKLKYSRGKETFEKQAEPRELEVTMKNILEANPNATPAQKELRAKMIKS